LGQHEIEIAVAVRGLVEYGSGAWPSVFVVEDAERRVAEFVGRTDISFGCDAVMVLRYRFAACFARFPALC